MSSEKRREIAYWMFLIIGLTIVGVQCYKYAIYQLVFDTQEIVTTIIAVTLTLKPNLISDSWTTIIHKITKK